MCSVVRRISPNSSSRAMFAAEVFAVRRCVKSPSASAASAGRSRSVVATAISSTRFLTLFTPLKIERIVVSARSSSSGRAIAEITMITVDPLLASERTDWVLCNSLALIASRSFPNWTGNAFDGFRFATVAIYTALRASPAAPAACSCWLKWL